MKLRCNLFVFERFFAPITALHSLTQCSTYNSTPPLGDKTASLVLEPNPTLKTYDCQINSMDGLAYLNIKILKVFVFISVVVKL